MLGIKPSSTRLLNIGSTTEPLRRCNGLVVELTFGTVRVT
jgi:hypothetical protein